MRLAELDAASADPALWNAPARAQALMRERGGLIRAIDAVRAAERELDDALTLVELAEDEGDATTLAEAEGQLTALEARADKLQLESLLSGEADANDC